MRGQFLKLSLKRRGVSLIIILIFGENELEIFASSTIFSNNGSHHNPLPTDNTSPTDHQWRGSISIHLFLQTLIDCIFVHLVSFSSNSTFIDNHIDSLVQNTIRWYFHPIRYQYHIPRNYLSPMNGLSLPIPQNLIIISIFCHFVQLIKLPFLLIITDSRNKCADKYGYHDRNTIDPKHIFLFTCEKLYNH